MLPDFLEQAIVIGATGFQIEAEIEKRSAQDTVNAEIEGDEQAPDPAIAVEEGVDRFELDMEQPRLDERREFRGGFMHETLEGIKACMEFMRRRRDEQGVPGARTTDPVLRSAEFAGFPGSAPAALQQPGMHAADETERQRQCLELFQSIHHCIHIVRDFADIIDGPAGPSFGFEAQKVGQG